MKNNKLFYPKVCPKCGHKLCVKIVSENSLSDKLYKIWCTNPTCDFQGELVLNLNLWNMETQEIVMKNIL